MNKGRTMVSNPGVSVVIPAYNRSRTIAKSISSVLAQTYSNLEVLVIDDGSIDDTEEAVLNLNDSRIRYHKLDGNHGAAYARNVGVELARGQYIAFNDSDDAWRPYKLEHQIDQMGKSGCDICIGRMLAYGYHKEPVVIPNVKKFGHLEPTDILRGSIVGTPTLIASENVFREVRFNEGLRWCEDLEWSYRACQFFTFNLLDEILVDVYLQNDSVTKRNLDKRIDFYNTVLSYDESFKQRHPEWHSIILQEYGRLLIEEGLPAHKEFSEAFRCYPTARNLYKKYAERIGLLRKRYLKKLNSSGD